MSFALSFAIIQGLYVSCFQIDFAKEILTPSFHVLLGARKLYSTGSVTFSYNSSKGKFLAHHISLRQSMLYILSFLFVQESCLHANSNQRYEFSKNSTSRRHVAPRTQLVRVTLIYVNSKLRPINDN